MKHWTSETSYVAALMLLIASVVNLTFGGGWTAVVCVALGVLLLLALRALEAWQANAKAADVAQAVADLTAKVKELDTSHAKTAEDASTALRAVQRPVVPKGPAY